MARDVNELIGGAIDRAEAINAEAHEPDEVQTGSDSIDSRVHDEGEVPVPKETRAPEEGSREPGKEGSKGRERDQTGKFLKGKAARIAEAQKQISSDQTADEGTPEAVDESGAEETPPTTPPIEAPSFWSAELKEAVAKGSKEDVVKHFQTYDQQRIEWANRIARESESDRAVKKQLFDGWEERKSEALLNGINNPLEELGRLRAWDEVFKKDVRSGIRQLMLNNKLSPYDFIEDESQTEQIDPRYEEIETKFQEQTRTLEELRAWKESQEMSGVVGELEQFKNGTDAAGRARRAFVDSFEPEIARVISLIRAEEQSRGAAPMTRTDALHHAYTIVLQEKEKQGVVSRPQPKPETVIADAKKAVAASGSVSGGPRNGVNGSANRPQVKGKNWDQLVKNAVNMADEYAS